MRLKIVFSPIIILSLFSSCSDNIFDTPVSFDDCPKIYKSKILTAEESKSACIYEKVYYYQSEYYFVCHCCRCNKLPKINNCDGDALDVPTQEEKKAFYDEAEYLFNIVGG